MNEEYIKHIPKDEIIENEKAHPLDKVIASILQEQIDAHIDFHSINRNDLDAYAQAVIEVTKSVSRAVYKDGFEEELINYIDEGRAAFEKIRNLIETHPYTTNKGISDNSIETTKQLYTDKTNEILEKINNFVEE